MKLQNMIPGLLLILAFFSGACSGSQTKKDTPADNGKKTVKKNDTTKPDQKTVRHKNPVRTDDGYIFYYHLKLQPKQSIYLTGTFNGWTPDDIQFKLKKGTDGVWKVKVKLDPGRYEYKFVVDGKLVPDYFAKELEADGTGDKKSMVTVK